MIRDAKKMPCRKPDNPYRKKSVPMESWAWKAPSPLRGDFFKWIMENKTILWPNAEPLQSVPFGTLKMFPSMWEQGRLPMFDGLGFMKYGNYKLQLKRNGKALIVRRGNRYGRFIDCHDQKANWPALAQGFRDLGYTHLPYPVSQGAVAAGLMYDAYRKLSSENLPDDVLQLAWQCCRGGRMETASLGTFQGYMADISSAYPYELAQLLACDTPGQIQWRESNEFQESADYGFCVIKADIPTGLKFGPLPVRMADVRQSTSEANMVFPVGKVQCHVAMPELRLLRELEIPLEILKGAWGFCRTYYQPFTELMETLYLLREYDPDGAKQLSVAGVGQLGSTIAFEGRNGAVTAWQGRGLFQPVYFATVYSSLRAKLYRKAMEVGLEHVKSFHTDGIVADCPIPASTKPGFGKWRKEGNGDFFAVNDYWADKVSSTVYRDYVSATSSDVPDGFYQEVGDEYVSVLHAFTSPELARHIGGEREVTRTLPLGTTNRIVDGEITRGRMLSEEIQTKPKAK